MSNRKDHNATLVPNDLLIEVAGLLDGASRIVQECNRFGSHSGGDSFQAKAAELTLLMRRAHIRAA